MTQKNQVNVDGTIVEYTTPVYQPGVNKYNMMLNYAKYPQHELLYQDKTAELAIENGVAKFLTEFPIDVAKCL